MTTAAASGDRAAAHGPAILHEPWRLLARASWLAIALLALSILVLLSSRGIRLLVLEEAVSDGYAALSDLLTYKSFGRIILTARYVVIATYLLTAFFIFWRKSHEVIGLATSLLLLLLPLLLNLAGEVPMVESSVFSLSVDRLLGWTWALALLCILDFLFVLFVFPNGRTIGPRSTRLAWSIVVALAALLGFSAATDLWGSGAVTPLARMASFLAWGLLLGLVALGLGGQVYRYWRVSSPAERRQTRWVVAALVVVLSWVVLVGSVTSPRSFDRWSAAWGLLTIFGTVLVAALPPLAIARAIVSHHLWDIDVIIRKTLVYTLLTGFLALVYLGSILGLQGLFRRLTGQDSTLATILSTLLIAALFLPVRRQIQALIDRRFYRRKYNAQKTLQQFAMTARDETDLDRLTAELLRVIQETMQPEHVSVWLRPGGADSRPPTDDGGGWRAAGGE